MEWGLGWIGMDWDGMGWTGALLLIPLSLDLIPPPL